MLPPMAAMSEVIVQKKNNGSNPMGPSLCRKEPRRNHCTNVALQPLEMHEMYGTYPPHNGHCGVILAKDGVTVGRDPSCWESCEAHDEGREQSWSSDSNSKTLVDNDGGGRRSSWREYHGNVAVWWQCDVVRC